MPFLRSLTLALIALALLATSWLAWRDDRRARAPLDEFVTRYELDVRRPSDVAMLRLQPQADLGAVIVATMTLEDVYGSVRLHDLDAAARNAWIRSVSSTDARIGDAIDCELDAIARRPGWAFHESMLAQLAYTMSRRESPDAVVRDAKRWETASMAAIALAPGNLAARAFLGGVCLETWDRVSLRTPRLEVVRAALRSDAFVERSWSAVAALAGRDAAIELLPDDVEVLRLALAREAREGDVGAAGKLRTRLDASIRNARLRGLARLELLARRGDRMGLEQEIPAWLAANRLGEIDTIEGRREVSRVAALVPPMRRGQWPADPRARLLAHLLSGREREADGESLTRLAASLSSVPGPIEAKALAAGGEPFAARELLLASPTRGSFEWTPAVVAIARSFVERGDTARARSILEELAPAARDECDALLALRDAAEAPDRALFEGRIAAAAPRALPASAWSNSGSLALCVDPTTMSRARLSIALDAPEPALLSWGWQGGRAGSVVVRDRVTLNIPLAGLEGRVILNVHREAGGPVELGAATIQ
ncbi:MAG: hypothetical protein HYU52_07875 [Acidobacteria bacterium]|nr:hypothetical protein [Acidobacteriota bacterium]